MDPWAGQPGATVARGHGTIFITQAYTSVLDPEKRDYSEHHSTPPNV